MKENERSDKVHISAVQIVHSSSRIWKKKLSRVVASVYIIWGFCIDVDEIIAIHVFFVVSITSRRDSTNPITLFLIAAFTPLLTFWIGPDPLLLFLVGSKKQPLLHFLAAPTVSLRNLFTDAWRRYIIKGWTAAPQQQQPTPSATQLRRAPSLWPKTYSTSNKKMLSCHHYTLSLATTLLFTLAVLICHASVTSAECACRKRSAVRFDDCKPGEISARDHRQLDVGLVGDCLPEVPDAKWVICANELSWISLHSW